MSSKSGLLYCDMVGSNGAEQQLKCRNGDLSICAAMTPELLAAIREIVSLEDDLYSSISAACSGYCAGGCGCADRAERLESAVEVLRAEAKKYE